jgi:hypothetical protein
LTIEALAVRLEAMEKPYELKALGQKIIAKAKADGLELAEEAAEKLAKAAFHGTQEWLDESAAMTGTPLDDLAVKALDMAAGRIEAQIEKIDLDGDGN